MVYVIQVLLASRIRMELQSSILISLASCQQNCMTYTTAVFTVKNSWWWAKELSETCWVLFQKETWEISASSWFYYRNLSRCMVTWTSDSIYCFALAIICSNLTLTMHFSSHFISAASMYRVATGYYRVLQHRLRHVALSTARLCLQRLGILHLQLLTSPYMGLGYWMGYICLRIRIRR